MTSTIFTPYSILIILNVMVLVMGSALSYYLARLTLQPIEASMAAQSRFASDASHELRTPLAVMQTEIEVVLRKPHLTLAQATDALRSNLQELKRLQQLAEGLLRLSQPAPAQSAFTAIAVDAIISDALNQVLPLAQARRITIIDKTRGKLLVNGDATSLTQALVALLDNAIKYSPKKRKINLEGRGDNRHAYITVRDQGPGIAAGDLPQIFERFYRSDAARSNQDVAGYGLGLSVVKSIIEQHRGTVSASSTVGRGSTFTIKLPLHAR